MPAAPPAAGGPAEPWGGLPGGPEGSGDHGTTRPVAPWPGASGPATSGLGAPGGGPAGVAQGPAAEEAAEARRSITRHMAGQGRDPEYAQLQRLLASRRRMHGALTELTLLLDVALSVFALLAAEQYRPILARLLAPFVTLTLYIHVFALSDTVTLTALVVVLWPVVFSLFGLYRPGWAADRFSPVRALGAVAVSCLALSSVLYFLEADRTRWFVLFFSALDAVLLVGVRVLLLRPLARLPGAQRRVLVVGTGRLALDAARAVAARRRRGLALVGVVGTDPRAGGDPELSDGWSRTMLHVWASWRVGTVRDVPRLVRERGVDLVLVALGRGERGEVSWLVSALAHLPIQLCVVPDVAAEAARAAVEVVDGLPVLGLTESAIAGWAARAKRALDLALALPALALLTPLLLAIAAAIRVDTPGPALFRQERVGQHNRRFTILKFRTMYVDAEARARAVAVRTTEGLVHKRRDDPRVTRVGAWLRRTSLDELPQLVNVVLGDMSLVGPRPELPWLVERYHAWQYRRLLVPQGITGWWQVHGRSDRVLHLHTQDDLYYVRNASLALDLKILLLTIKVVLTGKGAF